MSAKSSAPTNGDTTKLVIVESPAKSRSIAKFLGDGWIVDSSVGHIRDLPRPSDLPTDMKKGPYGKFAVDTDDGFEPYYVVADDKKKKVTELRKALKTADELYLATDADREGEAIAWHLLEVLKPKVPVYRMAFTEITEEGIDRALENIRELDTDLVDAQETRRILDRLYGYEISPVLWRKVGPGLSAGRVQSVATRLVVERERERMAFVPASYWDITANFFTDSEESFAAKLSAIDDARVATGRDFNDDGQLKPKADVVHLDEASAQSLAGGLENAEFAITSLEDKPYRRRPAAPFTTSTLQQEASRRLRFTSRVTMQVAQRLYENGYITYMRTDSVILSSQAISAARNQATELYGGDMVPDKPRYYASRNAAAQEAHEAIRPSGDYFRTPSMVKNSLTADEFRLYELIWKRTVASQMVDATGYTATVKIGGTSAEATPRVAEFSASGTVITVLGFMKAYESDQKSVPGEKQTRDDARLPDMTESQILEARDVEAEGHETTPPSRYTEASLVAELEKREIGRPSTYAPTISTIVDRGYVRKRGSALVPSWTAFSVIRLLEEHFGRYVDYKFTARMEDDLDQIAAGQMDRQDWLAGFYFGSEQTVEGLKHTVENLGDIDARAINSIPVAEGITLRVGRYGPYLEQALPADAEEGSDPQRANVPEEMAPDELTSEVATEMIETAGPSERPLGTDPDTGYELVAKDGRYGPYVTQIIPDLTEEQIQAHKDAQPDEYYKNGRKKPKKAPKKPKPKTGSLLKGMEIATMTLDDARKILSLPRSLGTAADGEEITAQNGRFGPYLRKGSDSRSLESEEQLFTITLAEAEEIYSKPKQRRGRGQAKPPIAEFGNDPSSGKKVVIKDGRFGPYITDGSTNVTVPRGTAPEQVTEGQAFEMLAEKRAKGPAKKTKKK
ncbi:type I DNA topoisomerase [Yaniella halotolerans]|uniref:type I DNA topoisomerase n=1 Tax=Yaniella halotolerans TaxID=225453 RepID=UPI0003B4948E|nr:type I DNA topoisomerase [Yaniella halotolerans]